MECLGVLMECLGVPVLCLGMPGAFLDVLEEAYMMRP